YRARIHPPLVESAKTSLHRAVMRHVNRFTTWSEWAKRSLERDYGARADRITVIHPGAVLDRFPDPAVRASWSAGPLKVLFVGGDFVRKGGDLLLDVWRRELRDRVELHLVTGAELREEPGIHVYRGVKPYSP